MERNIQVTAQHRTRCPLPDMLNTAITLFKPWSTGDWIDKME